MKKIMLAGAALITMFAGAAMAYHDDVDVLMMGLQPVDGIHVMDLTPDGPDLQLHVAELADVDVTPSIVGLANGAVLKLVTLTEPFITSCGASEPVLAVWRVRGDDIPAVPITLLA